MGKAYSSDLRERVFGDIESGQSRRAAARRFGVSASTGVRIAERMATKGTLEPEKQGRPRGGGKLAPYAEVLTRWVEEEGDITMPELSAKLEAECGVTAHPASLSRFLKEQGFTTKKNTPGQRSRSR
jgi:transposase